MRRRDRGVTTVSGLTSACVDVGVAHRAPIRRRMRRTISARGQVGDQAEHEQDRRQVGERRRLQRGRGALVLVGDPAGQRVGRAEQRPAGAGGAADRQADGDRLADAPGRGRG